MSKIIRCDWATHSILEQNYHDTEWGIPLHNDLKLFQMLILEGKQAGLSWLTILKKRDSLRQAFDNFDPYIISKYDDEKIEILSQNPGVIRNKLKIKASRHNANIYLELIKEYKSLDNFLWRYVDFKPILNQWENIKQVPSTSKISDELSKDLKKQGFKFVGSTTVYAFMQAVGMVNDHLTYCDFYKTN